VHITSYVTVNKTGRFDVTRLGENNPYAVVLDIVRGGGENSAYAVVLAIARGGGENNPYAVVLAIVRGGGPNNPYAVVLEIVSVIMPRSDNRTQPR
jgi:hypothetical protein